MGWDARPFIVGYLRAYLHLNSTHSLLTTRLPSPLHPATQGMLCGGLLKSCVTSSTFIKRILTEQVVSTAPLPHHATAPGTSLPLRPPLIQPMEHVHAIGMPTSLLRTSYQGTQVRRDVYAPSRPSPARLCWYQPGLWPEGPAAYLHRQYLTWVP